jgi:serine/threonine-protein kinase
VRSGTEIAGRYRLDEKIASGGMGEVWKGTDARLKRTVAIKLLHSGLSGDDRFRARFEQEARAVASLQSPGIVALYDYGEDTSAESRMSYLVMELVQGKSLSALIKEFGRFGPDEVMDIMGEAAEALDTAHRAGVIHRDIKPANLLVSDDFNVKIVDFGIASARGSAGLTETGTVIGTLNYASPEQLNGEKVGGASDLYSLGVVAYECLAGKPPFTAEVPVAIMNGHINMPPPPLPDDVPEPVAEIVMRTLSKDPAERWESAADLAAACHARDPGERRSNTGNGAGAASSDAATKLAAAAVASSGTREMPAVDDASDSDETGAVAPVAVVETGNGRPVWPLLSGAGGVVVLAVLLVLWSPWDTPPATILPSEGETTQVEEATESPSEEPTTYEEWTGNSGGGNQPTEEPTSEEPTSEEPTETETPSEEPTTEEPTVEPTNTATAEPTTAEPEEPTTEPEEENGND